MSYGQSSHSNGPWQSQPAAGSSTYPSSPSHAPAPRGAQESQHPGWLARSLFWSALIIGALPAMVLAPLSFAGGQDTIVLFSLGTIVAGGLRLFLGAIAILLVKNTTWVRRAVGAIIFVLGCLALLVLSPLMSMLVGVTGAGPADSMLTMTVIQGVVSGVYLSAVFCGWNIARNRRWWILVIAVALAVVLNIVNSIFNQTLAAQLAGGVVVTVVVQALWLAATFGVLGLCHLLGRVRGGTVPMPVQPAPIPQQGYAPHQGYAAQQHPQSGGSIQSQPNQWRPRSEQWSRHHQ